MAAKYWIKEATGLTALAHWYAAKSQGIRFEVSKKSSFGLAVEGIALGLLYELKAESQIDVECTFDIASKEPDAQLGIFDGLFGLALVRAAKTVKVPSSTDARSDVLDFLWKRSQAAQGAIGDGKRRSLVFRDPDEPVPPCLGGGNRFPKRDRFGTALYDKAIDIGAGDRRRPYSASEEEAITFIYEAARNSFEHGRISEDGSAISGIRGLQVERLSFGSRSELQTRGDLSDVQREYFDRQWPDFGTMKTAAAYTVADLGPGIHRTLPPGVSPNESAWERLERAFRPGESRKPKGADVESGMGLPKLYEAARRLRALLCIRSGELLAYADFSRTSNLDSSLLTSWREAGDVGRMGTSLTLIWPLVDQLRLL